MRSARPKAWVRVSAALFAAAAVACAGRPALRVPPSPRLCASQIGDAAAISPAALDLLARRPTHDYRQTLSISVIDGVSGRGFDGRGALVVRPSRAMRMILLGPGGTTAMDTWIGEGRFRVAIPALSRVVRGDARTPSAQLRGLPIALLWRWVVDPFGGSFVAARYGRVSPAGDVVDDPSRAGFVSFFRRPEAFEVRARVQTSAGTRGEGWWLEGGARVGHVLALERAVDEGGGRVADFPGDIEYVSLDPPMTVRVRVEETAILADGALAEAALADPDRP